MSGKYEKKKSRTPRKKKHGLGRIGLLLLFVLLIGVAGLYLWLQHGEPWNPSAEAGTETMEAMPGTEAPGTTADETEGETQETPGSQPAETEASPLPLALGKGLWITDIGAYTGAYVEDGSDEVVSDVLMIIVENTSEEAVQYGRILLDFGDTTGEFTVTTLPAGRKAVLLDQNRMICPDKYPDSAQVQDLALVSGLELYPDLFEITGSKGSLNVKNVSEEAVSGDVYVYYKNSSQDLLYGGITYRVKVDGLEAGQSKQVIAAHYNPTGSAIMMVTYIPQ